MCSSFGARFSSQAPSPCLSVGELTLSRSSSFCRSIPPATRYLTAILLAVSALGAFLRITAASSPELGELASYGLFNPAPRQNYPWLYLVPGNIFYTPWTLLLAGFAEGNLIEVSPNRILTSRARPSQADVPLPCLCHDRALPARFSL